MEITSRLLLKSAESLIKKKEKVDSNINNTKMIKSIDSNDQKKIKDLYQSLKDIQYQYTKEQTRLEYLLNQPELISKELKFNSEILFPEFEENWDYQEVLKKTKKNLEELSYKLRRLEIEQENYFAANFLSASEIKIETLKTPYSNIDPNRVSELTRNQFLA